MTGLKAMVLVAASSTLWVPELPEHMLLIAISGLCGGVARWIAAREKLWPEGLSSVILGLLAAVFLWPVAYPLTAPVLGKIDMDPITSVMFGGFVAGLGGVALITFIIDITRGRNRGGSQGGNNE